MNINDLYDTYGQFLVGYVPAELQLTVQRYDNAEKLEHHLTQWNPAEGWLSRQSQVQVLCASRDTRDPNQGHILAGEFYRDGATLHIRQKQQGWVVTEAQEGSGFAVLMEKQTFVADPYLMGGPCQLLYHRYWIVEETGRPKQQFAAFKGFVNSQEGASQ